MKKIILPLVLAPAFLYTPSVLLAQTVKVPMCLQVRDQTRYYVPCTGIVPVDTATGNALSWSDVTSHQVDTNTASDTAQPVQNADGSKIASETQVVNAVAKLTDVVTKLNTLISATGTPLQAGGTVNIGTMPAISVTTPAPVGGASETSLVALRTALGTPFQAGGSIGNTAFGATQSGTWNVGVTGTVPVTGTFYQSVQPVSQSGTWNFALGTGSSVIGSISNTSFGISGTLPAFTTAPTVNLGTLNGAATAAGLTTINNTLGTPFQAGGSIANTTFGISGTLPGFAAVPTFNLGTLNGAATATLQTDANALLTTIATNTAGGGGGSATSGLQTAGNTTLTTIANNTASVSTSTLQTAGNASLATIVTNTANLATSGNQTTANGSLAAIATNTTGVATAANQATANTSLSAIATSVSTVRRSASTAPVGGSITTANTFQSALASNASRNGCFLQNTSANTLLVFIGAPGSASANTSFQVSPGGSFSCTTPGGLVLTDQISVTSATVASTFVLVGQ